jgi:hypothetical protein
MLGCSGKYAAEYLNNLPHSREMGYTVMTPGVHIDHIKPKAAFDLSDPKQQLQFNHYTNLQLLECDREHKQGIVLCWQKAPPQKGRLVHEQPHEIAIA